MRPHRGYLSFPELAMSCLERSFYSFRWRRVGLVCLASLASLLVYFFSTVNMVPHSLLSHERVTGPGRYHCATVRALSDESAPSAPFPRPMPAHAGPREITSRQKRQLWLPLRLALSQPRHTLRAPHPNLTAYTYTYAPTAARVASLNSSTPSRASRASSRSRRDEHAWSTHQFTTPKAPPRALPAPPLYRGTPSFRPRATGVSRPSGTALTTGPSPHAPATLTLYELFVTFDSLALHHSDVLRQSQLRTCRVASPPYRSRPAPRRF